MDIQKMFHKTGSAMTVATCTGSTCTTGTDLFVILYCCHFRTLQLVVTPSARHYGRLHVEIFTSGQYVSKFHEIINHFSEFIDLIPRLCPKFLSDETDCTP